MTLWRAEFFPRVLFFSNSVSLGVFSHSKGPGAGRSSPNPTAQGSQRFAGRGSQEDVSRRRFPGRGSQARFRKSASKSSFLLELQFLAPLRVDLCALQVSLCRSHCNGCVKVAWRHGCMRNTSVFRNWTSYIALEWSQ